ncbi:hypothetical protein Ciccas_004214 [Cichlidogyrus casuarinus]|uniref:Uncharacterized protein n=1 Tax=Cichlidogyrus casuarinus TaxID=1844966 RepID=A0ABD2QCM1_9PLAT
METAQVAIAKCLGSQGKPLLPDCITSRLLQPMRQKSLSQRATFQLLGEEKDKAEFQMHKLVNRKEFVKLSFAMAPEMCLWQSPFSLLFQLFGSAFDQTFDHSAYCAHFLFCQLFLSNHQSSLNLSGNGVYNGILDGWFTKSRLDQFLTALPASSTDFALLQILLSLLQQFAFSESFLALPNGIYQFFLGSRERIMSHFLKCIGSNSSICLLLLRSASCGAHPEKGKTDSARLIRSRNRLLHQFLPQFFTELTSRQPLSHHEIFSTLLNWGTAVLRDAKSNPYADLGKTIYVCKTLANLLSNVTVSPDLNTLAEQCYLLNTAFELMSTYDAERDRLVDCFMGCAILHPLAHLSKVLAAILAKQPMKSLATFWRTLSNPNFLFRFLLYRSIKLRSDSLAILGHLVLIPAMQPLLNHLARVYRNNFTREATVSELMPSWPQCEEIQSPFIHNPIFSIAFGMSTSDCSAVRCEAYRLLISLIEISPRRASYLTIAPSFYEKHKYTLKEFATPPSSDSYLDITLNCSEIPASTNNNALPINAGKLSFNYTF